MKRIFLVILLITIVGIGWWTIRPLLFDDVVEEEFPPITKETSNSEDDPLKDHGMTQEEIDVMPEAEKMAMEKKIVEEMMKEADTVMQETLPETLANMEKFQGLKDAPSLISQGYFFGSDNFHKGEGIASLYTWKEGSHLLRLENFSVTNGPDLRIYLTKEVNPTKEQVKNGLELARLKGNKGNQNYDLPFSKENRDYKAVIIYCKPFNVIFATANLN